MTATNSRMRTLAEFPLKLISGIQEIATPADFMPVGVGLVYNSPRLFALVQEDGSRVIRHFRVMNVGDTLNVVELPKLVGSFGGGQHFLPFHVFQVTPLPADDEGE